MQLIFARAESAVDMIGQATNDVQQPTLAGGLKEGDACFNQMPGAIKLVALRQVAPAFLRGFCRKVRIEIAIVTLRGGHQFNHLIGGFLKCGIGLLAQ